MEEMNETGLLKEDILDLQERAYATELLISALIARLRYKAIGLAPGAQPDPLNDDDMLAIEQRVENDAQTIAEALSADPETFAHNIVEHARFAIERSNPRR